jgi:hypothetical protein
LNRIERRRAFNKYKKVLGLGTWDEYNSTQIKSKPYVNTKKRMLKELVKSGISYKFAREKYD